MTATAVPAGHNSVCPYLTVTDVPQLIEFLQRTFRVEPVRALPDPTPGSISHAELRIGDSIVMMGESPNPMPGQVHCYVEDVDAAYQRALAAGATSLRPPIDMFYGDRVSMVKDQLGNIWAIATHKEDVSDAEMHRRMTQQGK
jgi:PhnB protein